MVGVRQLFVGMQAAGNTALITLFRIILVADPSADTALCYNTALKKIRVESCQSACANLNRLISQNSRYTG